MFGHLKAEEFVNTLEGVSLSERRTAHLTTCRECRETLQSIRSIRDSIAHEDTGIPEPDWSDFRQSVRAGLLARSVKRDSTVRRWTGWPVRPAMAWGVSLVLLICVSAGGFLWHLSKHNVQEPLPLAASQPAASASDAVDMDAEMAAWGQSGLFEDLATIQQGQIENVRKLLLAAAQDGKLERR